MNNKKVLILFLIAIVTILSIGGYYIYTFKSDGDSNEKQVTDTIKELFLAKIK